MKTINHCIKAFTLVSFALLLNGCAGYQLGTMLPDDIKTVYVPVFLNDTDEPLIETEITRAVIKELRRDGSLKAVDEADADSILLVRIKEYELKPQSFVRENRSRVNQYRANISAEVYFQRKSTGEILAQRSSVTGYGIFDFQTDLISAKRLALPEVADDLAHEIVELIVEAWN